MSDRQYKCVLLQMRRKKTNTIVFQEGILVIKHNKQQSALSPLVLKNDVYLKSGHRCIWGFLQFKDGHIRL